MNKPSWDLAQSMQNQLAPTSDKEKLTTALAHLRSAADSFEKAGNQQGLETITETIQSIAERLNPQPTIRPETLDRLREALATIDQEGV